MSQALIETISEYCQFLSENQKTSCSRVVDLGNQIESCTFHSPQRLTTVDIFGAPGQRTARMIILNNPELPPTEENDRSVNMVTNPVNIVSHLKQILQAQDCPLSYSDVLFHELAQFWMHFPYLDGSEARAPRDIGFCHHQGQPWVVYLTDYQPYTTRPNQPGSLKFCGHNFKLHLEELGKKPEHQAHIVLMVERITPLDAAETQVQIKGAIVNPRTEQDELFGAIVDQHSTVLSSKPMLKELIKILQDFRMECGHHWWFPFSKATLYQK